MLICWGNSRIGKPGSSYEQPQVVLKHPMRHTNFQGHRRFGSREEDFLRILLYMGMAAILVMWPGPFEQTFVPLSRKSSIWNFTLRAQWFLRRRCLKSVDDDGGLAIL